MTDKELDEFIKDAERYGSDTWWIMDFCDDAIKVARELKELRRTASALAKATEVALR